MGEFKFGEWQRHRDAGRLKEIYEVEALPRTQIRKVPEGGFEDDEDCFVPTCKPCELTLAWGPSKGHIASVFVRAYPGVLTRTGMHALAHLHEELAAWYAGDGPYPMGDEE